MISLIRGKVRAITKSTAVIEAGGVGYEANVTQATVQSMPAIGEEHEILTRLIVREDSMTLFGFANEVERTIFDHLLEVKGVGPKTAIGIISAASVDLLVEAIRANDIAALTRLPNVGKKTAEYLVVALRDKLLKDELAFGAASVPASGGSSAARADALQALQQLGYQRAAAEKAIREIIRDEPQKAQKADTLLRAALMRLRAG